MKGIRKLMDEPILNWWGEDDWLDWFRRLEKATEHLDQNHPVIIHMKTLLPDQLTPHGLHHSRWRLFFSKLKDILLSSPTRKTGVE